MLGEKEMTVCSRASLVRGKEREPGFRLFCLSLEACLADLGGTQLNTGLQPATESSSLSAMPRALGSLGKKGPHGGGGWTFFFFFSEVQGRVLLAPATPNMGGVTWGGQAE